MKQLCLSIRQPWATAIVDGIKTIENRKGLKNFRGRFFVHAAKMVDLEGMQWCIDNLSPEIMSKLDFQTGGIIGHATVIDCVQESDNEWFIGPNGFVLVKPKRIDFQPCNGQLGFFRREVRF